MRAPEFIFVFVAYDASAIFLGYNTERIYTFLEKEHIFDLRLFKLFFFFALFFFFILARTFWWWWPLVIYTIKIWILFTSLDFLIYLWNFYVNHMNACFYFPKKKKQIQEKKWAGQTNAHDYRKKRWNFEPSAHIARARAHTPEGVFKLILFNW